MSVLAVLLVQIQPLGPKIGFSAAGMWLLVAVENRTTSYTVRTNAAENAGLTAVFLPDPTVGFLPLIDLSASTPFLLQPNRFWPAVGFLPHLAEWKPWAIHLPTEN